MSDPRFLSMHLEGEPRREQFRAARQAMQASCGMQTLAGDLRMLADHERLDVPTLAADFKPACSGKFTIYLKEGNNVYPLRVGLNSVGRLPDNDVVIRDECVSRRHCAILVHSDYRCELHDVASKNGTILNGRKIASATRLQAGDQILLCNRRVSFHVTESDDEHTIA